MAILKSEDGDFESSITITAGKIMDIDILSTVTNTREKQKWQLVDLALASGNRHLNFISDPTQTVEAFTAPVESISEIAHSYVLCRAPSDEPQNLVKMLSEFGTGKRSKLLFEPSEPSFELSINTIAGSMRVELFIDAGNVETGIYRWDSFGIRFFTSAANLEAFSRQLQEEFGLDNL